MTLQPSLRRRLTLGVLVYAVLVALAVATHGYLVNERAERLVWESLLSSELDHFVARRAADPDFRWTDTETLKLYGPLSGRAVPHELASLPSGVHDEVPSGGVQVVTLVRHDAQGTTALALDISGIEQGERRLTAMMVASALIVATLLAFVTHIGAGWLVRPLASIANTLARFAPDRAGQRVVVEPASPREAIVIAEALNAYLRRIDEFVERERAFVNTASHELRTPIAVISGAAEVALDRSSGGPSAAEPYLQDILRSARDMQRLVDLLLALAKDPARLHVASEQIELNQLVPLIVADHEFLAKHKELSFELDLTAGYAIRAPLQVARAAIGNLVRNAIENSDRGTIRISLGDGGKVIVADPGHGMSAAEMSALYTRLARSRETVGSAGIGLDLIARLCEHLGWQLTFSSEPGQGTVAVLDFRASAAAV